MLGEEFLLIAEIGGNHQGSFERAKRMADLAIDAGARVIKYQIYTGRGLVNEQEDPARVRHFAKFALSKDQYVALAEHVAARGGIFNASIWEKGWIRDFDRFMTFYKVGSGDLTAHGLIREIIKTRKPIVLSTGLATLDEVEDAVEFVRSHDAAYMRPGMVGVLQCTSMYPIPDNEANLLVMDTLRKTIPNIVVGYSDHTVGTLAAKVAVARGARILEVHFSDNRNDESFRDHKVSFEASDITELLSWERAVSQLLGDGVKRPMRSELDADYVRSFRRAVYLNKDMAKGQVVGEADLVLLRPNHGIDARAMTSLIGKRLTADVKKWQKLDYSFFE